MGFRLSKAFRLKEAEEESPEVENFESPEIFILWHE